MKELLSEVRKDPQELFAGVPALTPSQRLVYDVDHVDDELRPVGGSHRDP